MIDRKNSVITGRKLVPIFSLGPQYVSCFLEKGQTLDEESKVELELGFEPETGLVQLMKQPDYKYMWGSMYNYYSGTTQKMKNALKNVADAAIARLGKEQGVFLDCASNDFTLLSQVPESFTRIGMDPSDYWRFRKDKDIIYIQDYFSKENYEKHFTCVGSPSVDIFTACAVFYDIDKPKEFLNDVADILNKDGIVVIQLSYNLLMDKMLEVGNIVHEHLCYYSLFTLEKLVESSRLVLRDAEINDVNGGSIRLYLQRKDSTSYLNFVEKAVADARLESLRALEMELGYDTMEPYLRFYENLQKLKEKTQEFLQAAKRQGKKVVGAGASTKFSTLAQYFGIGPDLVSCIGERQAEKHGKFTVTGIPIVSEEEMRAQNPDCIILFPWFFLSEFLKREAAYLAAGGKVVTLQPEIRGFDKQGEFRIV
jgi:NDP-4-keto-2,6-dideoxyhexose 3-C-methyltransferase